MMILRRVFTLTASIVGVLAITLATRVLFRLRGGGDAV